jgi:glutamine cyclotransferase
MLFLLALLIAAFPQGEAPAVPVVRAEVVARHPHDRAAFTQGLVWQGGALFESTGREGASEVRRVRLADGRVLQRAPLPPTQFGEGLAASGNELVSLTWRSGVGYRWNAKTLKRIGTWRYTGEGWGLASDGRRLILSDGSAALRFIDPTSFAERGRVTVTLNGRPLDQLNELEWVGGALYANVWHQPYLVRIDTASGKVTQIVDLRPIVAEVSAADPEAVANGIAWDPASKRLYVTGKLWPTLFEVKLAAH